MHTLTLNHLSFCYPAQTVPALEDISLCVPAGSFTLLCGTSGSGKSTLLRLLKPALAPHGIRSGQILWNGQPLDALDARAQSTHIAYIAQCPDDALVTDKVWHELAFGLESLGYSPAVIGRRVAEICSFLGIETLLHREVHTLSGGQKQLVCLASALILAPSLLLLDEPTSMLDPVAAAEFLSLLVRLNHELGITIVLAEHHLEDALALAQHAVVLEQGRIVCQGTPAQIGRALHNRQSPFFAAMPTAMRVSSSVPNALPCPVSVREGRTWLQAFAHTHALAAPPASSPLPVPREVALEAHDLHFGYSSDGAQVVYGLTLCVGKGEFVALLGGNGAGKSTVLALLAGLHTPQRGTVTRHGKVVLLPQDPQTLFCHSTVQDELAAAARAQQQTDLLSEIVSLCALTALLPRHPYDLSGGEQQRLALALVLLAQPDILLLDEPTKGLDAAFQIQFACLLHRLLARGMTLIMVSHDVEFCACYVPRCALLFDGRIAVDQPTVSFFSDNRFFTTAAARISHAIVPHAVTADALITACGGTPCAVSPCPAYPAAPPAAPAPAPLSRPRRAIGMVAGLAAVLLVLAALGQTDLRALTSPDGLYRIAATQLPLYGGLFAALLVLSVVLARHGAASPAHRPVYRALSRTTWRNLGLLALAVPALLWVATAVLERGQYTFVSLALLAICVLPLFVLYEGKPTSSRELVVVAVLCALAIAGRAFFFMLPQFKPVMALVIISGAALGPIDGFLVGAMTMLCSNLLFAQGPWTPWQMAAMGAVGLLAGLVFYTGRLVRHRAVFCLFGAVCALVIYGPIVNLSSALLWSPTLTPQILLAYALSGLPMDCVHAAATALFLWWMAVPLLDKLARVGKKYNIPQIRA